MQKFKLVSIASLLAAITFNANASLSFEQQMTDRYGSAIAGAFSTNTPKPKKVCTLNMTVESTGAAVQEQVALYDDYQRQGKDLIWQEEDESGSTTIRVNEITNKGSITIRDESKVIVSGLVDCNRK